MSILKIVDHEKLPTTTTPYTKDQVLGDDTKQFIKDLIETSMSVGGYGLAAPQVGVDKQVFVYRKAADSKKYNVVFNPFIKIATGKITSKGEGCLSVKNERRTIKRAKNFTIVALDEHANEVEIKASNKRESIILQHEIDHLIGVTILDY